eukprot:6184176-Pleurochrysis_carterae.AAC.3
MVTFRHVALTSACLQITKGLGVNIKQTAPLEDESKAVADYGCELRQNETTQKPCFARKCHTLRLWCLFYNFCCALSCGTASAAGSPVGGIRPTA